MQQIKLVSHVGDDGILRLEIPTEVKEMDVEVTVTVESVKTETTETLSEAGERLAKVRELFRGRQFADSTELLREDRQR